MGAPISFFLLETMTLPKVSGHVGFMPETAS